jgi:hypothetical protein
MKPPTLHHLLLYSCFLFYPLLLLSIFQRHFGLVSAMEQKGLRRSTYWCASYLLDYLLFTVTSGKLLFPFLFSKYFFFLPSTYFLFFLPWLIHFLSSVFVSVVCCCIALLSWLLTVLILCLTLLLFSSLLFV